LFLDNTTCSSRRQGEGPLSEFFSLVQVRGVFGVAPKKQNMQVHTHQKYKSVPPQPTYDWMVGRYILDRNGVVWHKQANGHHKKHLKTASQLARLKQWKPLYSKYASKFKKLGFARKYWADPDPRDVPGFHVPAGKPYVPRPRHKAVADLREKFGDVALLPH